MRRATVTWLRGSLDPTLPCCTAAARCSHGRQQTGLTVQTTGSLEATLSLSDASYLAAWIRLQLALPGCQWPLTRANTSPVVMTSPKNMLNVLSAAACSSSVRVALASDSMMTLQPSIIASRAEDSQQTFVSVPETRSDLLACCKLPLSKELNVDHSA